MSTPSTITPTHPLHHFYPRFPEYQTAGADFIQPNSPNQPLSKLPYNNYNASGSSVDQRAPRSFQPNKAYENVSVTSPSTSNEMAPPRKRERRTNWADFYKNGIPKEVIVIDDSPEPAQRRSKREPATHEENQVSTRQYGKRRKLDATSNEPLVQLQRTESNLHSVDDSTSNSNGTSSRGRTNSAIYSTTATSLNSSSSSSLRSRKVDNSQAGRKRKRTQGEESSDEESSFESVTHTDAWEKYIPPPKPPIKAQDVYVNVVRDKTGFSAQKHDDEDGHYVVLPNTDLTERYTISRLLGQGTFGKVVEAWDKKRNTKCAVKIIRAIPKYRDASRIELRVLSTLAQNDKYNRNKCIHLRDCFDFRNHICIVTDLLSSSVFDFLKANSFTPFPSSHIQSFARQLFTSVAFLHDLNLIHTDLKPENILLVSSSYQTFTYERIIPSSTRSICRNAKQRKVLLNPEIRLIDFGSATFEDEYHSSVVSTRHYRAPEIILNLGWSYPCDIWSIGCILVEFFTGDALFQTHDNLEHLAMMEPVCGGKIEKEIIDKVRQGGRGANRNAAASYFRPKAPALDYPNSDTPRTSRKYVKNMKTLRDTIPGNTSFNRNFLDLLHRIFVYDPRKRITAKDALQHPWFRDTIQDDGTEALRIRLQKEAAANSGSLPTR